MWGRGGLGLLSMGGGREGLGGLGFGVIANVGVCVCEGGGGREGRRGGAAGGGFFLFLFSPSNKQTLGPPSPKKIFFLIGVCGRAD